MDLQTEIASLSPDRRNLLALMLESVAEAEASAHRISRRETADAEVSFAQQRLWFLQKLNPSDATYNTPAGLRISGNLRIEILEKVFSFLISRHESLRLVFKEEKGRIFQQIQKPFPVEIIEKNLGARKFPRRSKTRSEKILKFRLISKPDRCCAFIFTAWEIMNIFSC